MSSRLSPTSSQPGSGLWGDRYAIKREHARGGMGRVLLALDNDVGREVALKELLPHAGGGTPQPGSQAAALVERFLREARITGQLEHPNIVPVYEIGERPDGSAYYTMKFVRGKTLSHRIAAIFNDSGLDPAAKLRARLSLLEAFTDVCNAIAYAHAKGVVHRDLKPANVMLGDFGETLVLDWGLARVVRSEKDGIERPVTVIVQRPAPQTRVLQKGTAADSVAGAVAASSRIKLVQDAGQTAALTLDGTVVGTPAYMPPEQARGELESVDELSDVYSLGAMLYEILTGRPPYDGPVASAVLQAVLDHPPKPVNDTLRDVHGPQAPSAPPELVALCESAMARERSARMKSAKELAGEVRAFRDGRVLSVYRYSLREHARRFISKHRGAVTIAVLAVLALGIASSALVWRSSVEQQRILDAQRAEKQRLVDERMGTVSKARAALAKLDPVKLAADAQARRVSLEKREGEPVPVHERETNSRLVAAVLDSANQRDRIVALLNEPVAGEVVELAPKTEVTALATQARADRLLAARLAALNEDFALAEVIFNGAPAASSDEQKDSNDCRACIEGARNAMRERRKVAIDAAIADIRLGLSRRDRPLGAPTLAEYAQQLSGYRDEQTLALMAGVLAPITAKACEQGKAALWQQAERDACTLACRVLGALELPRDAVPVLAAALAGMWDEALAVECGLALCNTQSVDALEPLIRARERLGTSSGAWNQISRRLARVPEPVCELTDWKALEQRASIRRDKGDQAGALADLNAAIAAGAGVTSLRMRGRVRQLAGDLDGSMADVARAIELGGESSEALTLRGIVHSQTGNLTGGIADFTRAIELDKDNETAHIGRGAARFRSNDVDGAYADFSRAIEINPASGQAYGYRGLLRQRRKEFDLAIADYTAAINIDPRDSVAHMRRGDAYIDKRQFIEGLSDLSRAIELDQRNVEAYATRGDVYFLQNRFKEAKVDYDYLLTLKPNDARTLGNRGSCFGEEKNYEAAFADFERSLQIDPTRPDVYYAYGLYASRKGDIALTRKHWSRVIELNPVHERADMIRGWLKENEGK